MVEEEKLEEETDTSGHGDATAPHATPTICLGTCGGYHPPVGHPLFAQHWPYPNHSQVSGTSCTADLRCVRSDRCTRFERAPGSRICQPCDVLQHNQPLLRLVKRANDAAVATGRVNNLFLTHHQFQQRYDQHRDERGSLRMQILHHGRKVRACLQKLSCMLCDDDLMTCFLLQIESYEERMSEHGRFLIALSELDVPRVRQLVATALKAGRSISYIVDKLFDAANGLYRPKGYDDKELDLSFLILKVGTAKLILMHAFAYTQSVHLLISDWGPEAPHRCEQGWVPT